MLYAAIFAASYVLAYAVVYIVVRRGNERAAENLRANAVSSEGIARFHRHALPLRLMILPALFFGTIAGIAVCIATYFFLR